MKSDFRVFPVSRVTQTCKSDRAAAEYLRILSGESAGNRTPVSCAVHQLQQDHAVNSWEANHISAGVRVISTYISLIYHAASAQATLTLSPSSGQSDYFSRMGKQSHMEFSTLGKKLPFFCMLAQRNCKFCPIVLWEMTTRRRVLQRPASLDLFIFLMKKRDTEMLNVISCPISRHNCWFPLKMMDSGQKISWKMYFSPSKSAAGTNALKTSSAKGNGWPLKKSMTNS